MQNVNTSPRQTVGGTLGHWSRRAIHVLMVVFPIAYFLWGDALAAAWHMSAWHYLLLLLAIIVVLEIARIKFGFILFGQRQHEVDHISSFAWSAIAIITVLIFLPNPIYAIPIVAGCAVGDPLLGELRARYSVLCAAVIAALVIALIWWFCSIWMNIPAWLPLILGPVTVWVERPNLQWIDDNALMMWVPLVIVWVILF